MANAWTYQDARALCDRISDHIAEWQGIPVPLGEDSPLVLARGHPLHDFYRELDEIDDGITVDFPHPSRRFERTCGVDDVRDDEYVVNQWWSRQRNCTVLVVDRGGRRYSAVIPVSPDRSMERLNLWLTTLMASDAWDEDAEEKAGQHLRGMLTARQWRHYRLTGSFIETSPRSHLTYVFRRLRPTIVMSPRGKNVDDTTLRCIAILCLHPIGYYARSWAGCMVPTDDVIAHLAWMRGDEAGYWRHANQHAAKSPEAGL